MDHDKALFKEPYFPSLTQALLSARDIIREHNDFNTTVLQKAPSSRRSKPRPPYQISETFPLFTAIDKLSLKANLSRESNIDDLRKEALNILKEVYLSKQNIFDEFETLPYQRKPKLRLKKRNDILPISFASLNNMRVHNNLGNRNSITISRRQDKKPKVRIENLNKFDRMLQITKKRIDNLLHRWNLFDSDDIKEKLRNKALLRIDKALEIKEKIQISYFLLKWKYRCNTIRSNIVLRAISMCQVRVRRFLLAKKKATLSKLEIEKREEEEAHKQLLDRASILLQSFVRQKLATKKKRILEDKFHSRIRLQRFIRERLFYLFYQRLKHFAELREDTARRLQCCWRNYVAKRKLRLLFKIQRVNRLQIMRRWKQKKILKYFHDIGCAVLIQRFYRNILSARLAQRVLQKQREANASTIRKFLTFAIFQYRLRELKIERLAQHLRLVHSVTVIQTLFRRCRQRWKFTRTLEEIRLAKIESKAKSMEKKRKKGRIYVSRKMVFRQLVYGNERVQQSEAIKIQKTFRMYRAKKARILKLKKLSLQKRFFSRQKHIHGATTIQRIWRGYFQRYIQDNLQLLEKQRRSACVIQNLYRRKKKSMEHTRLFVMNTKAEVIQNLYRTNKLKDYNKLREARNVLFLQRVILKFIQRRKLVEVILSNVKATKIRIKGSYQFSFTKNFLFSYKLSTSGIVLLFNELKENPQNNTIRIDAIHRLLRRSNAIFQRPAKSKEKSIFGTLLAHFHGKGVSEVSLKRQEVDQHILKFRQGKSVFVNLNTFTKIMAKVTEIKLKANQISPLDIELKHFLFGREIIFIDSKSRGLDMRTKQILILLSLKYLIKSETIIENTRKLCQDYFDKVQVRIRKLYQRFYLRNNFLKEKRRILQVRREYYLNAISTLVSSVWRGHFARQYIFKVLYCARYVRFIERHAINPHKVQSYFYDCYTQTSIQTFSNQQKKIFQSFGCSSTTTVFLIPNEIQKLVPYCKICNLFFENTTREVHLADIKDFDYYQKKEILDKRKREHSKNIYYDRADIACEQCAALFCNNCAQQVHCIKQHHEVKKIEFCSVCQFQGKALFCLTCFRNYCDICFINTHTYLNMGQQTFRYSKFFQAQVKPSAILATKLASGKIEKLRSSSVIEKRMHKEHMCERTVVHCDMCKKLSAVWFCQDCAQEQKYETRASINYCYICYYTTHDELKCHHKPRKEAYVLYSIRKSFQEKINQFKLRKKQKLDAKNREMFESEILLKSVKCLQARYRARIDRARILPMYKAERKGERVRYKVQKQNKILKSTLKYKIRDALNIAPILETDDRETKLRKERGWKENFIGARIIQSKLVPDIQKVSVRIKIRHCSIIGFISGDTEVIKDNDWIIFNSESFQIIQVTRDENRPLSAVVELDYEYQGKAEIHGQVSKYLSMPDYYRKRIIRKRIKM